MAPFKITRGPTKLKDVYIAFHESSDLLTLEMNVNDWIDDNNIKADEITNVTYAMMPQLEFDCYPNYSCMITVKRNNQTKRKSQRVI